ncbi:MAG: KamA family radical SAM protein [Desulfobacteraceae bacterium]|nr:KamA family radical SAM protein [Desulfobacteraceae bacterium]
MSKKRDKLLKILDITPELKEIMVTRKPLAYKRDKFRKFITSLIISSFEDNPAIAPLEWVMTRTAVDVCRSLLSKRNEHLAGFSFLAYLNDILHNDAPRGIEKPDPGFFVEVEHLLRGISGQTMIYEKKPPAFVKYSGRKAALLRSADLSRMARASQKYLGTYTHGLSNETIRRRSINKMRILKYFNATEFEWERWNWHTSHIIRDADTLRSLVKLSDTEYEAIGLARKNHIPFGITPYYLSLMDNKANSVKDAAVRAQVIPPLQYVQKMIAEKACSGSSMDFMLENDTSPIEGVTRRYPNIVILKPILTCPQICVYCQRNWEIEDVYSANAALNPDKLDKALEWIENTPEINEVLVTGGDPFLLSNKKIENLMSRIARNPNVVRIRIGTRTLVTLPQRITDSLVKVVNRYHTPGKREVIIITHFEHPYEVTPQAMEAVQKFKRSGMEVYNQLVYTFFNSRKFEAAALRQQLRLIGVTPYYTFNTKGKEETDDYRVPIARLLQEQKEEARLMPGTVRTDEIVFNVPGLGKNYLDASQHHSLISILPNGQRVYEFHPWEKKLSLADTYVYKDVSIFMYLKRLKAAGEDLSAYKSIWHYY